MTFSSKVKLNDKQKEFLNELYEKVLIDEE
jgi:hypothetical protein